MYTVIIQLPFFLYFTPLTENLCLSDNIRDYHFVSQGKIEIPGVDDSEEMGLTDVSIVDFQRCPHYMVCMDLRQILLYTLSTQI